jgi:hypothetical protein
MDREFGRKVAIGFAAVASFALVGGRAIAQESGLDLCLDNCTATYGQTKAGAVCSQQCYDKFGYNVTAPSAADLVAIIKR